MAEINNSTARKSKAGVAKLNKRSTRIDLTPMVDLGFLLITFFIFTTSMTRPTAMKLKMPHDAIRTDSMQTPASGAMTIMMLGENRLYYYFGTPTNDPNSIITTDYKQIRNVILEKKRKTDPEDFMVLLKCSSEATYRNTVDMLDEMYINDVKRYALLDWNSNDSQLVH